MKANLESLVYIYRFSVQFRTVNSRQQVEGIRRELLNRAQAQIEDGETERQTDGKVG